MPQNSAAPWRTHIPTIACFSKAKTPLGLDLDRLIAALQHYVDAYLAPVWGTPATLVRSTGFRKHAWAIVFLDDADQADFCAYHNAFTPAGLPLSKVFVGTCAKRGASLSVATSHELAEMLVDPGFNLMARHRWTNALYAVEVADPVEADCFKLDGFEMSNFVYPSYFESFHEPASVRFDHLGHGYFFEQGNEVKNVMRHNLGMLSRRVELGAGLEEAAEDVGVLQRREDALQ